MSKLDIKYINCKLGHFTHERRKEALKTLMKYRREREQAAHTKEVFKRQLDYIDEHTAMIKKVIKENE